MNAHMGITGFNDYFIKKGFSINLLPKFILFSIKGFYIGPLFSFQYLSYKNKWSEQQPGYDKYFADYEASGDLKSTGYTFQFCFGIKQNYKRFAFELFTSIGAEWNKEKRTWYELNRTHFNHNPTLPYQFTQRTGLITRSAGIRIGFNFDTKKILRRHYLTKYVEQNIDHPSFGKLYRKKIITKKDIKEFSKRRRILLKTNSKNYKKKFDDSSILIEQTKVLVDSINIYIRAKFPSE